MSVKAKKVIEAMKEAFDIFDKMELPIEERECTIEYDSAKAIIDGFKQLERERDAAIDDLRQYRRCETCKHYAPDTFCSGCRGRGSKWEWRGPKA